MFAEERTKVGNHPQMWPEFPLEPGSRVRRLDRRAQGKTLATPTIRPAGGPDPLPDRAGQPAQRQRPGRGNPQRLFPIGGKVRQGWMDFFLTST